MVTQSVSSEKLEEVDTRLEDENKCHMSGNMCSRTPLIKPQPLIQEVLFETLIS